MRTIVITIVSSKPLDIYTAINEKNDKNLYFADK